MNIEAIEVEDLISPPPEALSSDDVLFEATCREGDKNNPEYVVRKARPMILGGNELVKLWFRLSQFPILFASPQEANFKNFVKMVNDEYSVMIQFDDVGMAMVTDIVPGVEARFHISFWDSRLKGREPLIRELVKWIVDVLLVRRVATPVRADARAMRAFLKRAGLYFEGSFKNWIQQGNKFYDLHMYGVTKPEIDPHWMEGRSWAKPRVKLLKSYETS